MTVDLRGVHFSYPAGRAVLRGVDLRVTSGERVAILGPNGAGKSTLLLQLNGILQPTEGTVTVGGVPVERGSLAEIRRAVGMVFQDPGDQLFMRSVGDDVAFGPSNLGMRGVDLDRVVGAALDAVGLVGLRERTSHHLSFGEQRRVAVATVLAMDPSVLALDEPTSNLDPKARRQLIELLRELDLTTLIATHDLAFALELCPRSVVLVDGAVVADGPTAAVLADDDLLEQASLELPYGLDRRLLDDAAAC
jgi:cobalt/nickel transport system ATP-binding protein